MVGQNDQCRIEPFQMRPGARPPSRWDGVCLSCSLSLRLAAVGVLPALSQLDVDSERGQGSGRRGPIDLGMGGVARMEQDCDKMP